MKDLIKVAHVVTKLETGGMENGIINLCNRHDRKRFDLSICCLKAEGKMAERLRDDIQLTNLKIPEGKPVMAPVKMLRYLQKTTPHIVHTHGLAGGSYIGIVGAKLAQTPVIINGEHGAFHLGLHQRILQKGLSLLCNKTFSVSDNLKSKIIRNLGIPGKSITVIPNGVDSDRFTGNYDCKFIQEELAHWHRIQNINEYIIIGCIGSLKPEKNQVMLLKALKEIERKKHDYKILILFIGDGPDAVTLKQYIFENGVKNKVVFFGIRNDIPQILSAVDIFVSTSISRHEGMSNVILEAMSSGLPAIATRSVGTSEIITDGVNGFIVEQNDVEALADKLQLLCDDKRLIKKMGQKAREVIQQKFSISNMVLHYERSYLNLLKKFKP